MMRRTTVGWLGVATVCSNSCVECVRISRQDKRGRQRGLRLRVRRRTSECRRFGPTTRRFAFVRARAHDAHPSADVVRPGDAEVRENL